MGSIRKKISTKFKNRYRLIIRKDDNLEEKVSLVLTPMNLVLVLSAVIVLFGTIIILLLSYTPMSSILPTTATNFSNKERLELIQKIDSLEDWQRQLEYQEQSLRMILGGEEGVIPNPTHTTPNDDASASTAQEIPSGGGQPVTLLPDPVNYSFYAPLKGLISDTFNVDRKHYALDIVAPAKAVVKAVQQGTVIFSAWNPESGYTLVIQHANDFLSVYKHNAVLLKKEGNFVRAGDAVALVGNTGELSSGPHLHFELWNRGIALDPRKYISF